VTPRIQRAIEYKLYVLDWPGRIAHVVELPCGDDEHALRVAAERADGRAMELWHGQRMVRRFSASPSRQ
jgi:hypothetical protein